MVFNNVQENIDHIFFLHASICKGRERLACLWEERKVTDGDILTISQELDALITEYQRIMIPISKSRLRLRLIK